MLGKATVLRVEFRRIRIAAVRPRRVARGREGHVAHAQRVEHAQHAQRATDGVATLDAGKRAQLLVLVRLDDICEWRVYIRFRKLVCIWARVCVRVRMCQKTYTRVCARDR